MNPEATLAELGLKLPPIPQPAGLYKPLLIVGDIGRVLWRQREPPCLEITWPQA